MKQFGIISRAMANSEAPLTFRYTLPKEYGAVDSADECYIAFTVKRAFLMQPAAEKAIGIANAIDNDEERKRAWLQAVYAHGIVSWETNVVDEDNNTYEPNEENFIGFMEAKGLPSLTRVLTEFSLELSRAGSYEIVSEQEKKV